MVKKTELFISRCNLMLLHGNRRSATVPTRVAVRSTPLAGCPKGSLAVPSGPVNDIVVIVTPRSSRPPAPLYGRLRSRVAARARSLRRLPGLPGAQSLQRARAIDFSAGLLVLLLVPWVLLGASAVLVWLAARIAGWSRDTTGALMLTVPLGNTAFLGIPMVRAFFGVEALPSAVMYDQLGTFLGLATYGTVVLAVYGKSEPPTPRRVLRSIATFPPFVCLIVALLSRGLPSPPPLYAVLNVLSQSLVPVVLVAIGLQLSLRLDPPRAGAPGLGLGVKLLIAPALALLIVRVVGGERSLPEWRYSRPRCLRSLPARRWPRMRTSRPPWWRASWGSGYWPRC